MAKRSTIGENPLDAVNQDHPLNSVVPDLSAVSRGGRSQPAPEVPPEVQERLKGLEAGLQALRAEVAGLRASAGEAAGVKSAIDPLQGEVAGLRREVEGLKAAAAAIKPLQTELTQFKAEIAQLRASAGPGDLPFWMRGRKK